MAVIDVRVACPRQVVLERVPDFLFDVHLSVIYGNVDAVVQIWYLSGLRYYDGIMYFAHYNSPAIRKHLFLPLNKENTLNAIPVYMPFFQHHVIKRNCHQCEEGLNEAIG